MKLTDLHYITAFYEGEGTCAFFRYTTPKSHGRLTVRIAQNTRGVLDWLVRTWGAGSVHFTKSSRCFYWDLGSAQGRIFLQTILPYMKIERKIIQAKKALNLDRKFIKKPRGIRL